MTDFRLWMQEQAHECSVLNTLRELRCDNVSVDNYGYIVQQEHRYREAILVSLSLVSALSRCIISMRVLMVACPRP
jgi:hypothetical protein